MSGRKPRAMHPDRVLRPYLNPKSSSNDEQDLSLLATAFARRPRYVGAFGHGTHLKFIANLLVAIHNVASAEAMAMAEAAGVDLQTAVDVLREGAGNSRIFELRAPIMARRTYTPATMKLDVWLKDMDLITSFARHHGLHTPVFNATRPVYDIARSKRGSEDTAAVFEVIRRS